MQLSTADTLVIDSWSSLSRYEALCLALGDGVAQHAQAPDSIIRELFDVRLTQAKLSKAERQARNKAKGRGRRSRKAAATMKITS